MYIDFIENESYFSGVPHIYSEWWQNENGRVSERERKRDRVCANKVNHFIVDFELLTI